ncbi:predicted protein [Nematostella vectensis]|uniref:G-protein coupled receptors family 1 profile domain-containing protein n=1 Tax=Nematostella vectensis TaxID=45351 RepID=A7RPQ9_NEMVE|nr:somatostatin receptor type 2 [Nematostella vectensis]XP_032219283.1 somatostatin receptor type 2 [Nematostella vectensis]XP_032219284.1 somatostatin receptor type 2 [Nematostella vectensis]XP_048581199.1 somatostatin receptor type 2 [Nematostella vectensis]EDO46614.1 predicted protein [Nematostella vectensis]|eukprot:XP_001638677.1 predicted protein [Nematostella vectensis]
MFSSKLNSTHNSSTNGSTVHVMDSSMSDAEIIAWCFAYVVVSILIIVGNSVAIVIFTTSKLMRKRTNYFLLSLAIADMMVGCLSLPMYIYNFVTYHRDSSEVIRGIFLTLDVFTGFASIFALAFIALERLYSVALPNWHHTTPSFVYTIVITVVWVLASLLASFRLMFTLGVIKEEVFFNTTTTCSFLSLAVIIIAYIGIGIKVKMRIHEKSKRAMEKDRKLAMTLCIVTLIYVVTWLPFYCMNVAFRFCKFEDTLCTEVPYKFVYFTKLLQYTNSFVNPIIYTFKIPEFRVALFQLIGRKARRRQSSALISMRDIKGSDRKNGHYKNGHNGNGNFNDAVFRKSRAESESVM